MEKLTEETEFDKFMDEITKKEIASKNEVVVEETRPKLLQRRRENPLHQIVYKSITSPK